MAKNSTDAFYTALEHILNDGQKLTVRQQEISEILSYHLTIENPLERVIVVPYRANNIFSTIAETMWVMQGRNDLNYLSRYLPNAVDFSDDGKVWRAGYGARLRNWMGQVDQIKEVLSVLSKDRNSRRAVMVIFNPLEDYIEGKDIPCNNWLQFIIRNNQLIVNIAIRSNDIICKNRSMAHSKTGVSRTP